MFSALLVALSNSRRRGLAAGVRPPFAVRAREVREALHLRPDVRDRLVRRELRAAVQRRELQALDLEVDEHRRSGHGAVAGVRQGPEGALYVLVDAEDGMLLKITP